MEHNALHELGLATFKMEINQFADKNNEEINKERNGINNKIIQSVSSKSASVSILKSSQTVESLTFMLILTCL